MRIFDFAMIADWEDRLQVLASMAEPERWKYLHAPAKKNLPVLDSYITHTFNRAFDQQKLVEADQLTCFNTGLLTPGHEEIFAIFSISEKYDRSQPISLTNKKWWLRSWVRSGDRTLTDFMEPSPLADYWSDSRELIFDPKLQVQLNVDQIIKDNLHRFPEELGGRLDKNGVPTDLNDQLSEDEVDAPEGTAEEQSIPLATRNALEGAMKHSIHH